MHSWLNRNSEKTRRHYQISVVGVVYISYRVVPVVVERTVESRVLAQNTGLDEISQNVDTFGFGQSDLLAGGL